MLLKWNNNGVKQGSSSSRNRYNICQGIEKQYISEKMISVVQVIFIEIAHYSNISDICWVNSMLSLVYQRKFDRILK